MKGRFILFSRNGVTLPSLWSDIVAINEELKHYAESHENVRYVGTDLFFADVHAPTNLLRIDDKLMPDRLHPSALGYDLWANEIVKELDSIL